MTYQCALLLAQVHRGARMAVQVSLGRKKKSLLQTGRRPGAFEHRCKLHVNKGLPPTIAGFPFWRFAQLIAAV